MTCIPNALKWIQDNPELGSECIFLYISKTKDCSDTVGYVVEVSFIFCVYCLPVTYPWKGRLLKGNFPFFQRSRLFCPGAAVLHFSASCKYLTEIV